MKRQPLVSILVHTRNSDRTIVRHIKSIKNQSYRPIEIVMVDNRSLDKTVSFVRQFTDKKIFPIDNIFIYGPERSAQRNFAAKKARGDYYLIPDSDMTLSKNVIKECVNLTSNNFDIKAVVIPEKSIGKGYWAKCKALERKCYMGDSTIEAARFFEKKTFWEMGGYDENITGPEDWDLPQKIRAKYKVGRIKSMILHDEGEVSLFSLAKKKRYYGLKSSRYIKKYPIQTTIQQLVYLLRPAFYRNWDILLKNPVITLGMIVMLSVEQISGFLGFIEGSFKNEKN